MKQFSVLMSVYFKEKPEYFNLALESNLINQTLCPSEFVLICDGELTPELEVIVEKYTNLFPSVLKVYRKENGGLGKALNFGLTKCTYSLIARSDSDDICANDRFEKQVNYMVQHPEIGIVGSYIDEFYDDWSKPINVKTLPLSHAELYQMAKFRNPLNHMSVMMRKSEILRIGSYHHIPYVEDYELWIRAMNNDIKIANIGEILVHARTGKGMIKRRGTKKYIKSWHLMNRYMIEVGMIGYPTYIRNMLALTSFVFMPGWIKEFIYKRILRK